LLSFGVYLGCAIFEMLWEKHLKIKALAEPQDVLEEGEGLALTILAVEELVNIVGDELALRVSEVSPQQLHKFVLKEGDAHLLGVLTEDDAEAV